MPAPETRFAVLLFTDIVGSTALKARHGVPAYSEALRTHNGHFERIAHECLNIRTLQSRGDGYFAEAGSIAEAVRFALLFQEAMRAEPWGGVSLAVCIGIHAGEVGTLNQEDGTWIVGPAADLAARITDLAMGGQILLTRFPFDEARHFIREHPPVAGKTMPPLCWLAHGPYLLKGRDEPMDIFEVGAEGLAPLTAPPDGDKAKRAIRPGEEETLGWRPAVGLEIPGRTGWQLIERLGAGGFGEVWVGEHAKLHQRRAFKFCFDDERLRALKREVTLVRLLRSALGERDDIVHIHELKLDAPPFYLESDLAPHGNLLQWAESQGGLDKIPLAQRIALVAHTATALAAAHSIGVLHKDIKPTNILIFDGPDGEPRPRLVDFGIGTLADPAILAQHGITGAGFTRATVQHSTGTPTYSPPEYLAGKPYTIQGDIYGLGVLLYQLITAKAHDPLAPGWERDVADPLLREDIAACVDGDPARRLPSATDLAERLLHLDQRRAEIAEKERLARETAVLAEAEAAAAAARLRSVRARKLAAGFAIVALLAIAGMIIGFAGMKRAAASEKAAGAARDKAIASRKAADELIRYMQYDLRDTLSKVGRLSLMQSIDDRIARYRQEHPPEAGDLDAERERGVTLQGQGDVLLAEGKLAEALATYREFRAIFERLAKADPDNAGWQRDLWVSCIKVGDVLSAQGQLTAALESYQKGQAIFERLAKADPANASWQRDLAMSYSKVGNVLSDQNQFTAALESYQKGQAIFERLAKADPANFGWQRDLAVSYERVGSVLRDQDQPAAALESYQKSLAIRELLAKADPDNADWQSALASSNEKMGEIAQRQKRWAEAAAAFAREATLARSWLDKADAEVRWLSRFTYGTGRCWEVLRDAPAGTVTLDRAQVLADLRTTRDRLRQLKAQNRLIPSADKYLPWIERLLAEAEAAAPPKPSE